MASRDIRRCCWARLVLAPVLLAVYPPHAVDVPVAAQTASQHVAPQVPYPNASKPAEILANIGAVARQTDLGKPFGMDALMSADTQLRARRILDVKSLAAQFGPDYFLVELDDLTGAPYARAMVTREGFVAALADDRAGIARRPLDLEVAADTVRRHGLKTVSNPRYVYAMSAAEPGSPVYMPLVAVETPKGTVYFNCSGQPFAELGSRLQQEASTVKDAPFADNPHLLQLRLLDRWQ